MQIGSFLKTKSIEEIAQYDKWEEEEKKPIRRKVVSFVNDYGLLYVLNELFFGLQYYDNVMDIDYLIDKIPVSTFIWKIIDGYSRLFLTLSNEFNPSRSIKEAEIKKPFVFREKGKGVRKYHIFKQICQNDLIKPTMPFLDYVKFFFPTYTFMYHIDEYIQMEYNYFAQYSEPVYLFLLAAKYFYDEFTHVREEHYSGNINLRNLVEPLNGIAEVVYTEQRAHYIFNMTSTFDAIRFKAFEEIINKKVNILVCPACGEVFEEIKHDKIFCSTKHQKRVSERNLQDNKKRLDKEKRRIEEIIRQHDLDDTDF